MSNRSPSYDSELALLKNFFNQVQEIMYDGEFYSVKKTFEATLTNLNIEFEEYDNYLRLKLKKSFQELNLKFYESLNTEIGSEGIDEDFTIISSTGIILSYNSSEKKINSYGLISSTAELEVKNLISYYTLFNFLRSKSFCDYFNDANEEIVIYSSAKGIFKIKYDSVPIVNFSYDITGYVLQLIEFATPIQINPFFKNSLFTLTANTGNLPVLEIIAKAKEIIEMTRRDYDLVSKQFDFEKFRDSLYKEKEKYFNNVREIVNKIFSQAIGIPISITATVFATYKVSDDVIMLSIVMLAFIIYVIFYIKIQSIYKADINEIYTDFKKDFEIIQAKSGLSSDLIENEKLKINNKITSSISMVNYIVSIVSVLGFLVCFYIIYQITKSEVVCLIRLLWRLI